jgi:hypothetical protein
LQYRSSQKTGTINFGTSSWLGRKSNPTEAIKSAPKQSALSHWLSPKHSGRSSYTKDSEEAIGYSEEKLERTPAIQEARIQEITAR